VQVFAAAPEQSVVGCIPTLSAAELSSVSLARSALGEGPLLPSSSKAYCDFLAPSPALDEVGPAPSVCLSEVAALGERLHYSLTVMSVLERLFTRRNPSLCLNTPGRIRLANWISICLRRLLRLSVLPRLLPCCHLGLLPSPC